jgi:hypothetical protein
MWQDLAASDPVACLALITKLLPNQELSEAIQQSDGDTNQQLRDITVRLVSDIPNALDYQSPAIEDKSEVDQ